VTGPFVTEPGSRHPPGATWSAVHTNFCVYSRQATDVELLLYADAEAVVPLQVIRLDSRHNRSCFFWHVAVCALPAGTHYNWRVTLPQVTAGNGNDDPAGFRSLEVLDPLCRAVSDRHWNRSTRITAPESALGLRGIVIRPPALNTPRTPPRSLDNAIIYELHVGGFTRHPSAGVAQPGTFAGLIEKIPYLRDLGITHVQLLPVAAFDEQDVPPSVAENGLHNYWGYSPYALCSPHPGYCRDRDQASQTDEFRTFVQALHAANIGVILDVVLNHTAESGAGGPVINYKGLMPEIFYHHDQGVLRDYTGCGNTINCNHPLVTQTLLRALEVWVEEFGVDGFRFDLASVFVRGEDGEPLAHPPFPAAIEFSPKLAGVPLIAEAWDAAGLYHVGNFPGVAWSEWNGRYRDALRRFLRGDAGLAGEIATCLAGSSDLYQASDRTPVSSINYITCHDGFTLNDLVSYGEKHNDANGEDNRDGWDHNDSWNCGTEGETLDENVARRRRQDARNAFALLLLSQGVPMLLAGDEVLRTQRGNNNAWCQNNEIAWFDWRLAETNSDMLRFVREMIALRRRHPGLSRAKFLTGETDQTRGIPDIRWFDTKLAAARWDDPQTRFLAFTLAGTTPEEEDLLVLINMSDCVERVDLLVAPAGYWHVAADTEMDTPGDIITRDQQIPWTQPQYLCQARSVVVFEARQG
jgi:glycogen operon protein